MESKSLKLVGGSDGTTNHFFCLYCSRAVQPVHRAAQLLIDANNWRLENRPELELRIAVGSTNKPQNLKILGILRKKEMLEASLDDIGLVGEIVPVPDIDDPPNWVQHAEDFHGVGGPDYN